VTVAGKQKSAGKIRGIAKMILMRHHPNSLNMFRTVLSQSSFLTSFENGKA